MIPVLYNVLVDYGMSLWLVFNQLLNINLLRPQNPYNCRPVRLASAKG